MNKVRLHSLSGALLPGNNNGECWISGPVMQVQRKRRRAGEETEAVKL